MIQRYKPYYKLVVAAFIILIVIPGVTVGAVKAATAQPPGPNAAAFTLTGNAAPGNVNVGDTIIFTVVLHGPAQYQLSIGIAGGGAPQHPSQTLHQTTVAPAVWTPRPGGVRRLTFGATVVAPQGATGKGLWCVSVVAALTFSTLNPPLWTKEQILCYLAQA